MPQKRSRRIILTLIGAFVFLWNFFPSPASAIPPFARRYSVGCGYCHAAWPVLNKTGKSFMMSGYRRADGHDLIPTKKDFQLTDKSLTLPAIPPFGIALLGGYDYQRFNPENSDGTTATRLGSSFDLIEAELLVGTPLGKHLSFFLDYELYETEIELRTGQGEAAETGSNKDITFEREGPGAPAMAMVIWNSVLPKSVAPPDSLNIVFGINELPLVVSPSHRRLSVSPYLIYDRRAVDFLSNAPLDDVFSSAERGELFRLSKTQIGIEANGVLRAGGGNDFMLEYNVGATNGSNNKTDPNTEKDVYVRVAAGWKGVTAGFFGIWSQDIYNDSFRNKHTIAAGGFFAGKKGSGLRNKAYSLGPDLTVNLTQYGVPIWIENQILYSRESSPTGFDKEMKWWGGFSQVNWKIANPLVAYGRYGWTRGDRFDDTTVGGKIGPVKPREWSATFGLQWYALQNLKLTAEFNRHEFKNIASTPRDQKITEDFVTIRFALAF